MKTFSEMTKEEINKIVNKRSCCDKAEFAGLLLFGATITEKSIRFVTENKDVLDRYIALGEKEGAVINIKKSNEKAVRYTAENRDSTFIMSILNEMRLIDFSTGIIRYKIDSVLIERECCRKAFIRGAFMSGGTVINPRKNYNVEIITPYMGLSLDMKDILLRAGFDFKSIVRKSKYVLYMKNSDTISDFLSYLGAFQSQMEMLNVKIEKEMNNDLNRTLNRENANLDKTINASIEQVKVIEEIDKKIGIENLPEDLREIAILRLENKAMSLNELGKLMNPPLSKSGVNHRIKKLMKFE